jgi:hypothetical protein
MNNLLAKPYLTDHYLFVFLTSFLFGQATYSLKLISIIKLLNDLSFKFYPLLMFAQMLTIFILVGLFKKLLEKSRFYLHFFVLALGLLCVFFGNNSFGAQVDWVYSCSIFLISVAVIIGLDMGLKDLIQQKVSLLQNPHVSGQLHFSHEFGVISGAICSLYSINLSKSTSTFIQIFPFFILLIFFLKIYLDERKKSHNNKSFERPLLEKNPSSKTENIKIKEMPKFALFFILLMIILALAKNFQGFAMILGIKALNESSDKNIIEIFSYISFIQNGLILFILFRSFFKKKSSTSWKLGHNITLAIHSISMLALSTYGHSFLMIGTGIGRKISFHSFLEPTSSLLLSSLPNHLRQPIRSMAQLVSQPISLILLSIFSFFVIFEYVPAQLIWITSFLIGILGFIVSKKLLLSLNKYHIQKILTYQNNKKLKLSELLNSCRALSNREASNHSLTLLMVNSQRPPSSITKSIIYALGEMKNTKSISLLKKTYLRSEREDVKGEIITSLYKFNDKSLSSFYIEVFEDILLKNRGLGGLKRDLCILLYSYDEHIMFDVIDKAISVGEDNPCTLANILKIIGCVKLKRNKEKALRLLMKYFGNDRPNQVRANAIVAYLKIRPNDKKVLAQLEAFSLSKNKDEEISYCYSIGELGLKQFSHIVKDIDRKYLHKEGVLQISLLRLGENQVLKTLAPLLFSSKEEDTIKWLKFFHHIKKQKVRFSLYSYILEHFPQNINTFILLLKKTGKDFDQDCEIIEQEAQRRKLEITQVEEEYIEY